MAVDSSHIYWADLDSIGRANLDGSGVEQNFVSFTGFPNVCGVAVNGTHVYWADRTADKIGRVGLNGSSPDFGFITTPFTPCGVAVTRTTSTTAQTTVPTCSVGPKRRRGRPSPSGTLAGGILRGRRERRNVYYGNRQASGLTDLKQINDGIELASATGAKGPCGIAVNSSAIYWTNYSQPGGGSGGSVGTAPIDAAGVVSGPSDQTLITGISEPAGWRSTTAGRGAGEGLHEGKGEAREGAGDAEEAAEASRVQEEAEEGQAAGREGQGRRRVRCD